MEKQILENIEDYDQDGSSLTCFGGSLIKDLPGFPKGTKIECALFDYEQSVLQFIDEDRSVIAEFKLKLVVEL